jgi:thiamine pyrophosphate-dependent acetolactate synthase large subunit-like protein
VVLNDDSLAEVKFEQREIGASEYGCLGHIDFAAFAASVGAKGFRVSELKDLRATARNWLPASGPAVIDVVVDPDEEPPPRARSGVNRSPGRRTTMSGSCDLTRSTTCWPW